MQLDFLIVKNRNLLHEIEDFFNNHDYWICYGGLDHGTPEEIYLQQEVVLTHLRTLEPFLKSQRPTLLYLTLQEDVSPEERERTRAFFKSFTDLQEKLPALEKTAADLWNAHRKRVVEESYVTGFDALFKVSVTRIKASAMLSSGKPVTIGEERLFCPGNGKWLEKDRVTPDMVERDIAMNHRLLRMRHEPGYVALEPLPEELKVYGYGRKSRPYTKMRKHARKEREAALTENTES